MRNAFADPKITIRIILADPKRTHVNLIRHENNTSQDITVLEQLGEPLNWAKMIRFVDFLTLATASNQG